MSRGGSYRAFLSCSGGQCPGAVARFNLAAVEWLKVVNEPNKVQLAFLAIINLLTEVNPYATWSLLFCASL